MFGGVVGDDSLGRTVPLRENGTRSMEGGIGVEVESGRVVGGREDGGGGEGGFEGGKSLGGFRRPRDAPVGLAFQPVVEGGRYGGVVANKTTVVVSQAEKGAKVGKGGRLRPGRDGSDFGRVGGDTGSGYHVAAEIHFWYGEMALSHVGIQLVVTKNFQDRLQVALVFFGRLGEDENVVQVYDDEGVEVLAEDFVHEALEGGWGVGEAKRNHGKFKMAIPGTKGSFGDVFRGHSDLVVALAKVNFGEDGGAVESVQHVVHAGEGVGVFDADEVEGTVVHAQPEFPILFADEKDRGPEW